jgi:spore coat polysaccharide biosynthesis protein SpsF
MKPLENLCIIQARTGSSRLPGKVLLPAVEGKNMLELMLSRVAKSTLIDKIIVATSTEQGDDKIEECVSRAGFQVFRGSLLNVLERFYNTALPHNPKNIIRLTADCPLIDSGVIDGVISLHLKKKADYTSNIYPHFHCPDGMDVEIFKFEMLKNAFQNASDPYDLEHVTPYIKKHSKHIETYGDDVNLASIRITLDYKEDYEIIRNILGALYSKNEMFTLEEIIIYLKENPEVYKINKNVNGNFSNSIVKFAL